MFGTTHWRVVGRRVMPGTLGLGCLVLASLALAGCAGGPRSEPATGAPRPAAAPPLPQSTRSVPQLPDVVDVYRRMGLLAEHGETPFVGSLSFFAGPRGDSTRILLTVALGNRALSFVPEGNRFRAVYHIALEVRQGTQLVGDFRSRETVRVLTFRETTREDESVLYRQTVTLAPGSYDLRLTVRDERAARGSAVEATIGVPRFVEGSVSSPVPVYEVLPRQAMDSVPRLLATPRATAVFGRDSLFQIYVEGYGAGEGFPLVAAVRTDGAGTLLWADTVSLQRRSDLFSGTFGVPVGRLGVGVLALGVSRAGGSDTVTVPLFVAFGEELPVASFADMLYYLRYFVSAGRIAEMRGAAPELRATLWAKFLRDTDPNPQTPQHEGLQEYFGRIAQANTRFREEGAAGWLTDRGRVYVALGEPDQRYTPTIGPVGERGRTEIWEYRRHQFRVVFVDQTGFGRWRMPIATESEFEALVRRVVPQ